MQTWLSAFFYLVGDRSQVSEAMRLDQLDMEEDLYIQLL